MDIQENVLLAPLTTFQIGGPARYLVVAQTVEDIKAALKLAKEKTLPIFILGGGSNLLVSDEGFPGVVIKIELHGVEVEGSTVLAAAGEGWDALVARACNEKLWGLENLSGIPGTVGGAVVQNIGAYGAALSETLLWVEVLDTESGEVKKLFNLECAFDYRDSIFKHESQYVVLRAAFELSVAPIPNVSYKDLSVLFADSSLDIQAICDAVVLIRKGKFPDLQVEGTAGSFFKNPILSLNEANELKTQFPLLPIFPMPETTGVKVPLAWFLDSKNGALNLQNVSEGGARLYEKQPLVIVVKRNTHASDVKKLSQSVILEVKQALNIEIEAEVKVL
jgi:UDP-N-acetylmuramate dehydrogenase